MSRQIYSVVDYYGLQPRTKCGYCDSREGHIDHGMWLHYLNVYDYQNLMDRQWRRCGCYCYQPTIDQSCCPKYTIRCEADNLKLKKNQKKIIKRFNRFITHGDRKKWFQGEIAVINAGVREHIEESHKPRAPTDLIPPVKESKNASICIEKNEETPTSRKQKEIPLKMSIEASGDRASLPPRNLRKKKAIRIERAKKRVMAKGKTEEEAMTILKAKKKYPKPKSLEELLLECVKPDCTHHLEIKLVQSSPKNDYFESTLSAEFDLYRKYQIIIHKDEPEEVTEEQFRTFLVKSPLEPQVIGDPNAPVLCFGSYHQQYWVDGKLIAVGVIDILPNSVSSVYFFYDPDYNNLVLGTYGSLRELQLVRELQSSVAALRYYHMGFYIHSCSKMRYKARISPSFLLCPEIFTWHPIEKCIEKINLIDGCRLNEEPYAEDENFGSEVDRVLILHRGKVYRYTNFRREFNTEDANEVKEYLKAVGKKCAYSMLLYRS